MNTRSKRWLALVVLAAASAALGEVKVDKMFSDHMVLQQKIPVSIWGTADPGEKVTVAFAGQTKQAVADKDGKWMLRLDAMKASAKGREFVVKSSIGNGKLVPGGSTFQDVLVGEVWIGSGQSNMAGGTGGYARRDEVLAAMVKAGPYPKLRLYRGGWKESTPGVINGFSAIMFSFGQPLQKELDVPVGLIVGAVGGTPSGRWLSPEMLEADAACQALLEKSGAGTSEERQKKYKEALAKWEEAVKAAKAAKKRPPRKPRPPLSVGDLYARFIKPVVPYTMRGVLWDQGESGTAVLAVDQFTLMGALIRGWRRAWQQASGVPGGTAGIPDGTGEGAGESEFPFLYIQKPSGGGCAWDAKGSNPVTRMANAFAAQPAKVNKAGDGARREMHIRIMQHAKTAMVSASDLGSGIHPSNKSGYGRRACRVALGFVYGRDVAIYGPVYESHKVEGAKVRVSFKHVGKGLAFRGGEKLQGFEIAGADGAYEWADAKIDPSTGSGQATDTVILSSEKVAKPVNVRYGWSRNHPWANLFNKDGLPALTFRTGGAAK